MVIFLSDEVQVMSLKDLLESCWKGLMCVANVTPYSRCGALRIRAVMTT
jgi:hypothetical protein